MLQVYFILISILFMSSTNSWVFNNVNYQELASKSFDFDLENELENEIDEEYFPQQKFTLIFPGTKWCGAGNSADHYEELGAARDADRCCRAHDHCADVIPAGHTRYNLTNEACYSRLSCECDESFRRCLRAAGSRTARVIGKMYFDAIGTKCFKSDYPIIECTRRGGWLDSKCVEYRLDAESERRYQWFDVPAYNQ